MELAHPGRGLAQAEDSEEEADAGAWVETDPVLDPEVIVCARLVGPKCRISLAHRATTQIARNAGQRW